MGQVPIAADGTERLSAEPVELHRLEILFKAQVDVNGAPGQLHDATVQLVKGGKALKLEATVEDAESGDVQDVEVTVPVSVEGGPPASGGPMPVPPEEEDLDWDDETTYEALFSDVAPPSARRDDDTDEADEPDDEARSEARGFEALLKALMELPPGKKPAKDPKPAPAVVSDPGDARGLLELLVANEQLELAEDATVDDLLAGAAPIVASDRPPDAKAESLSSWLFTQDAVEELYMSDDELASLLAQW